MNSNGDTCTDGRIQFTRSYLRSLLKTFGPRFVCGASSLVIGASIDGHVTPRTSQVVVWQRHVPCNKLPHLRSAGEGVLRLRYEICVMTFVVDGSVVWTLMPSSYKTVGA